MEIMAQMDQFVEQWNGWVQIIIVMVSVAGAAIWLRRSDRKMRHEELKELAETRGQRIEDLSTELDKLKSEVHELRGQVKALTELKASEIAYHVAKKLSEDGII